MQQIHDSNAHCGIDHSRSILQQDFWILRSRKYLKRIIRQCIPCSRIRQEPFNPQIADLPLARLPSSDNAFPFHSTGIDFFEPFATRNDEKLISKRYVLFFTCLVTRAVHSEVCHKIDADSTLQALRRFIARRGKGNLIFSDNGKCFVGANNEIQQSLTDLLQNDHFKDQCQLTGIMWKFIPPAAPHFGGSWEKVIKPFKDAFYKIIGTRILCDETLSTFTCEVEAVMNSRPLTIVSSDPTDTEALTPIHILQGRPSTILPPGLFLPRTLTQRKTWKKAQVLTQQFWNRYLKNYLPLLTIRTKWTQPTQNIQIGDLVWLLEDLTPRGLWPLGRVLRFFPGSDKIVEIHTSRGRLTRPVVKLSKVLEEDTTRTVWLSTKTTKPQ